MNLESLGAKYISLVLVEYLEDGRQRRRFFRTHKNHPNIGKGEWKRKGKTIINVRDFSANLNIKKKKILKEQKTGLSRLCKISSSQGSHGYFKAFKSTN